MLARVLIPFKELRHIQDLPQWVGCPVQQLEEYQQDQEPFYQALILKKRGRSAGKRKVYIVDTDLAAVQKHIARSIAAVYSFGEHVQGYVKKRSIRSNAEQHLARKKLLHIDIEDFFDSIHIDAVRLQFALLGCNSDIATILAKICTFNGALPQGASSSPILSNLVASSLDQDMLRLANASKCTYTRYADDLVFSGDEVPLVESIDLTLEHYNFKRNKGKTRLQLRGRSQYVTGLTVADSVKPHIPRQIKRYLRQAIYYVGEFGLESHAASRGRMSDQEGERIDGLINYVKGVDEVLGMRLRQEYNAALMRHSQDSQAQGIQGKSSSTL